MAKKQINQMLKELYNIFNEDLIVQILVSKDKTDVINVQQRKYTSFSDYSDEEEEADTNLIGKDLTLDKGYFG